MIGTLHCPIKTTLSVLSLNSIYNSNLSTFITLSVRLSLSPLSLSLSFPRTLSLSLCLSVSVCLSVCLSLSLSLSSRDCSTSLLKILWETEKLLVTSNFSLSHSVFYPFRKLSAIFIKI